MKRCSINRYAVGAVVLAMVNILLIACGGDSGSSTKPADDGREVATVVDMGRCTNEREGDTVYVAEKMTDYLCKNRTWVDLSTVSDDEKTLSSSSVAKGTLSAASGNSSAVQGTSSATSVSGTSAGKESDPAQGFIRENISVTGVAQKGPFKFGSPLNLYELKKNLNPSGRVYNDEINSNKGDFVIPKVSFAYPYAKLEVTGLYRNEVTGEWSKEPMTLFALTDFSDKRAQTNSDERVQVNINLLTHLEYDRALYLVQEKGYSVYAAKKQAAQEIMTAFEFATAVTYSEDFAIFQNDGVGSGTIAGNGTLLAISALVMGNRSDAEIQSVIDQFREDVKTDGEWNDLQTKTNMADWARDFKYGTIRAAVKSWNILDIPDYETYLDVYWNNVYGLGGCSEIRKGTVAPNSNKLSKYYNEYFICKVDGSKYSWVSATTIEKDTYEWASGKSGEFKKGNVTDTIYTYNGTKWEVAARETTIGVCGSKNAGEVSKFNGIYYICKSNAWGTATVLEYDTYGWKAGSEGSVKAGNVNSDKYYVYENGAWRASGGEIENNLGACVTSREGEVGESGNAYYVCKSSVWTTATGIEKNLGGCTAKREGEIDLYGNTYYICKNKTWTITSSSSSSAKMSSSSSSQNAVDPSTVVKGTMTDSRDGQIYKTVKIGNQTWMAENLNYKTANSYCYNDSSSYCSKYGRLYTWAAAMDSAGTWGANGKGCGYNKTCSPTYPVRGVCPEGWHLPTQTEWKTLFTAVGGHSAEGRVLKFTSGWYSNGNGTDAFSFSALPAGNRLDDGSYNRKGYEAYFWSSTGDDSDLAYRMRLVCNYDNAFLNYNNFKYDGYSVRCLQD
ncbi:fibrobacter succinogenes major paralogous domain-containing protein [Fibrobacter sp. UWB13]|uniref:fibrobacter succinogenes major paralogous domain-containing protein n=1 Tax=Fibrobacter sp. UWB13 TaxID=1896204 RepID=UPI000A0A8508|nr:fibrobacter succinogenes major paralogous domain-containing protein [Fibrobacter sp. UWB13]SMG09197.1 major paralogous domain-containing protein [Fibrobacter sp. UWB13]